jgi:oxygen-independent coproporphyrinogen-3 oxidase
MVQPLDEEVELAMYLEAMDTLEGAGFEHYEISSFARPGKRCRHNQVYWANHAYFGVGVGAARYIEGRRELNTRDVQGYVRKALAGEPITIQSECLVGEERARETIALQLRRAEGIEREEFRSQTGIDLDTLAGEAIRRFVGLELLQDANGRVRLTRRGKCVADALVLELS